MLYESFLQTLVVLYFIKIVEPLNKGHLLELKFSLYSELPLSLQVAGKTRDSEII
jgi:hypothetical protein